jgi:hypothetical protein
MTSDSPGFPIQNETSHPAPSDGLTALALALGPQFEYKQFSLNPAHQL